MEIYAIIAVLCSIVLSVLISIWVTRKSLRNQLERANKKAKDIIKEAEAQSSILKKHKEVEAKESFLLLKSEHEKEVSKRNLALQEAENRAKQKEKNTAHKLEEANRKESQVEAIRGNLNNQLQLLEKRKEEINKFHQAQVEQLEKIAGISVDDAKKQLIHALREESKTDALSYVKDIVEEAKLTAVKEAKKVIIETIQRTATEVAIENSVTVFPIESDELKGKIIGREGRNIRALEQSTGIEIIVDDTPEAIIISGFDPVRREIARLALKRLVADGRIHPARIEEVVSKTKKEIDQEVIEIGERTIIELGIHGLHPELVKLVGRMRYRSSYGQNLLQHSREVARLCATMSAELGINVKLAKRAGLLHDIGKVPEDESDLPHALLGMKLAEKYKEHPAICNAIGAHHDEIEMKYLISPVIQACDAISGARPGARREVIESYMKRLDDLEKLALSYPGVEKAFCIQAGRELRVMVESDKISDKQAEILSYDLSKKIQTEMTYPGQVKITVIRETRAVSVAK